MRRIRLPGAASALIRPRRPAAAAWALALYGLASASGIAAEVLPAVVVASLERHGLTGAGLGIHVAEITTGSKILSYQADAARNPASTMKVVTALAALDVLTPSFRWVTRVYAQTRPVDGVLAGDIYFVGGGDPYLVQERMWLLIQALRRNGITEIGGDLIVDASYFASIDENPAAFDREPYRIYNVVPSAVLANFNSIQFIFEPDRTNSRVKIDTNPRLSNLQIDNHLRTSDRACSGYRRGISMAVGDRGDVRFDGRFPVGCETYSFSRSVLRAEVYTGELFRSLWRESGGTWDGRVLTGSLRESSVLLHEHESVSLGEAVRLMNKHSSNLIARHLMLTLGAELYGRPATEAKGKTAITDWLESEGFDFPELVLENGAGRSRDARISARHLVDIIRAGWQHEYMPEFLSSLALMGQDGTLAERHRNSALSGRGHLKTGRLDHVAAIAGVYQHRDGSRYALAILHNERDVHRGTGEAVQDAILGWLSSHRRERMSARVRSRTGAPGGDGVR